MPRFDGYGGRLDLDLWCLGLLGNKPLVEAGCLGSTEAKSLHGNSATLTAVVIMPNVMRQNITLSILASS